MKNLFIPEKKILVLLYFAPLFSFAQQQADHWYFGIHAGIDFSSGLPVVSTDGQLSASEGCSSMSDASGNLLFYTDGQTVWNKNHDVMPNGTGLQGGSSSTQAALIVPDPADASQYYIFTTDVTDGPHGFQFSIVDMSLQSGLGDVTVKDSLIRDSVTEKLAAVLQGHKGDYWIAVHRWGNDEFDVYALTVNGLSATPVVSNIGVNCTTAQMQNTYGELKFSPCGDRLADAAGYLDTVDVFNFDIETGIVSNRIALPLTDHTYGVEFSPSEQLLYVTTYDIENSLLQYDLSSGVASDVITSKTVINYTPDLYALQLANDGRIYVCKDFNSYLDAIDSPNVAGLNCNYLFNYLNLDPNYQGITSGVGLPDFVASFFATSVCNALSSEDVPEMNSALIFPNPSADFFAINIPDASSEIAVYDVQGRLMEYFSDVHQNSLQFGAGYSPGIYFVSLKNKSDNFIEKIVKTQH